MILWFLRRFSGFRDLESQVKDLTALNIFYRERIGVLAIERDSLSLAVHHLTLERQREAGEALEAMGLADLVAGTVRAIDGTGTAGK